MTRPPIEEIKAVFGEKKDVFWCHITNGTIETVVALCDYALELEKQLEAEQTSVNELSLYVQELEARHGGEVMPSVG